MSSASAESSDSHKSSAWSLALAALGVVYGDIGTSPLYALRECFGGPHGIAVSAQSVFGVLSVVFWMLVIIISIKYILFVLRADNRGEGGILSLTALAAPQHSKEQSKKSIILLSFGVFGAGLLFGEGIFTPSISVLSAVEGLRLATPVFEPFVLPLTLAILCGLFMVQQYGTAKIGSVFGPVMMIWFSTLAALGLNALIANPEVLKAINPYYAFDFFIHHRLEAYFIMGSLFLVVTGGEALYADMGHFGRSPIRYAWFAVVLPALLLNYFGQGALLLQNPEARENPFYLLAPSWFLYPLVGLATLATVVASQALISGIFSLARQAIQLGLSPRLRIVHTSSQEIGQIYLPQVNWAMLIGCLWLVLSFKSSSGLAAAYGISVAGTMVFTTILILFVARDLWRWNGWAIALAAIGFLSVDLVFLSANLIKIAQGGWIPLLLGAVVFTLMTTWRRGRQILAHRLRTSMLPLTEFLKECRAKKPVHVPGVAVFMVGDKNTTPPALVHNVKHNKCVHDTVVILTVVTKDIPAVPSSERVKIEKIDEGIYRVVAYYGFIDSPDIGEVFRCLKDAGLDIAIDQVTFFLGRETLIASENPGMAIWREHLFSFMSKNAERATAFFKIPADQVIEVGIQVEL